MKRSTVSTAAFSLVELTLAIGVAAFALIAVFGLMPVGVQTNRNATSQTAASNIIASVIADMRATLGSTSVQYRIQFGTAKTLFFDGAGACSISAVAAESRINCRARITRAIRRKWNGSCAA